MPARVRLTILCENSVGRPGRLIGEHGFAALVEAAGKTFLFDTGQGLGLAANVRELGLDLAGLDGIVLSHGHYDHGDGLAAALLLSGPTTVYAHPDLFVERYWRSSYELRPIGLSRRRADYEALGARFELTRAARELATGLWLSGEVPRLTPYETGDPHLVVTDGSGFAPDPLRDDQSLYIAGPDGLVLLLGCAHAGVGNIMHHALQLTGQGRIQALVGGTHLGPAGEDQFRESLAALRRHGVQRLALGHCTGLARAAQLQAAFEGRCSFAAAGSILEF